MKKYKMRIKDDKAEYDGYDYCMKHTNGCDFVWLCNSTFYDYAHSTCEDGAKSFTNEEIEKMPYGFVNQYDLIEVKEQLYYIKLPCINGQCAYINVGVNSEIRFPSDNNSSDIRRNKFTKEEIEEKFSFYANETCMVKVEDDE